MVDIYGEFAISATIGGIAIWKIGALLVTVIATLFVANTIVQNPPNFPSFTLPKIEPKQDTDSKTDDLAPAIPDDPPKKKDTVIYRYGGTNPGNLTPRKRDVELFSVTGTGLSFSTVPKPGSAMTTIETLNATGIVYAVQDGSTHVSVFPVGGTLEDWYNAGSHSIWTQAVKSVVVKWDGEFGNDKY